LVIGFDSLEEKTGEKQQRLLMFILLTTVFIMKDFSAESWWAGMMRKLKNIEKARSDFEQVRVLETLGAIA